MDLANRTLQFPNATVIFTNDVVTATGKPMPHLYVQAIDAYGFQRELSVSYIWEPGNSAKLLWEAHAYQHPGRRNVWHPLAQHAEKFIVKFLDIAEKYPTLLFNETEPNRPRHDGFVHLMERLHGCEKLFADFI